MKIYGNMSEKARYEEVSRHSGESEGFNKEGNIFHLVNYVWFEDVQRDTEK